MVLVAALARRSTAQLSTFAGVCAAHKLLARKMSSSSESSSTEGERPYNFSWIVSGVLAGSAYPEYAEHFQYYHAQGIRHVVSLTEWRIDMDAAPQGMENFFLPITEFEPPSLEQIREFVDYVEKAKDNKQACVVHCLWGRGRTGTMLAAYLVKSQDKHPRDAIDDIRRRRPFSVETYDQEAAVFEYANYLKSRGQNSYDKDDNKH